MITTQYSARVSTRERKLVGLIAVILFLSLVPAWAETAPVQSYLDRAAKAILHARDTADPADFDEAERWTAKALNLEPGNFDAQRYRAMALLGKEELPAALALAAKLNQGIPDDIGIWALLADIRRGLGDYDDAERSAQWILDLRRNSPLGFIEAAQLREVFGDYEGAEDFYNEALRRTAQAESEERSWLIVQRARMQIRLNKSKLAVALLDEADKLLPGSLQVLATRAQLAQAQMDYVRAAALFEQCYQSAPTAARLYKYAQAMDLADKHEQAQSAYRKFEADPRGAGPLLVLYYAEQKNDVVKALALATEQSAQRHDVATLDAHAWALYRHEELAAAKSQMDRVIAIGTQEPLYICHAARIAARIRSEEVGKPETTAAIECETTP